MYICQIECSRYVDICAIIYTTPELLLRLSDGSGLSWHLNRRRWTSNQTPRKDHYRCSLRLASVCIYWEAKCFVVVILVLVNIWITHAVEDCLVAYFNWQACGKVVKYVNKIVKVIQDGLDGKNVDAALTEFGIRFHRVVYEHLQQFQYNSIGNTNWIQEYFNVTIKLWI